MCGQKTKPGPVLPGSSILLVLEDHIPWPEKACGSRECFNVGVSPVGWDCPSMSRP